MTKKRKWQIARAKNMLNAKKRQIETEKKTDEELWSDSSEENEEESSGDTDDYEPIEDEQLPGINFLMSLATLISLVDQVSCKKCSKTSLSIETKSTSGFLLTFLLICRTCDFSYQFMNLDSNMNFIIISAMKACGIASRQQGKQRKVVFERHLN